MTQTKESLSKSASSFAEFSKSVSSSAFETSKSIGSSVADVSVKAKDATVSSDKENRVDGIQRRDQDERFLALD